ncbi:MAG TPA: hypothetical protein VFA76_13460 [Terriglobales bacterium]|nr:hypothetical protein [Terriglobales bacterium]
MSSGPVSNSRILQHATAAAPIEFRDPGRAAETLARIVQRAPAAVSAALQPLLAESPDPDSALNLFDRLVEADAEAGGELLRLLDAHRFLIHYALVVFGYSRYLGDTLIRNPDLLQSFVRGRNNLDRSLSREEFHEGLARYRARSLDTDIALLLSRFKRREYVRIMLRDVLRIAPLAETTSEISALADVLIEDALREAEAVLRRRFEAPRHMDSEGRVVETPFAVLSLGKLGGNELNYSSDVDLFFLYGDGEELPSAAISNREYFIRLAQQVSEILSRMTFEGRVFRIDLRLRPQGREGEPAVALGHALRYYATFAHDWERQALIKVRYTAGDAALAREFIRGVQPQVYSGDTTRLNFAAIATALDTRERISARRRATHELGDIDVKLDRGGIRDIEFLVQCLQRVHGGAEPWLRSGGTLFSLQKLHDKGHITGKEFHELTTAYEFLRKVEHRLQLREGQQTHRLPQSSHDLRVLYRSVVSEAHGGSSSGDPATALHKEAKIRPSQVVHLVRGCMAAVADIYERIIHQQQFQQDREGEFRLRPRMEDSGAEQQYHQLLQRLAEESSALYETAMRPDLDAITRRNLYRFLSAAFTSSERYAALMSAPQAVERALALFGSSEYLTDILVRHPEEIETLAALSSGPRTAQQIPDLFAGADSIQGPNDSTFDFLSSSVWSDGDKLALLRRHYRHRVFASGAADILDLRPVYYSLCSSTLVAEQCIRAALTISGQPPGLAILAFGRLGTSEFDLLSDADVLFVRDEKLDPAVATKAAEQTMQALAAYTRDGTVFPVDARLRPHGSEGELVVTPAQLRAYCAQEAQPWEALTCTKLRWVAGSVEVGTEAVLAAQECLRRYAKEPAFGSAVRDMRRRLEVLEPRERNFKTDPGAVYDIDFITCYLKIRHQIEGHQGNLHERLGRLREYSLLAEDDYVLLEEAAELMRTVEHVVRLVVGRSRKTLPATEHARRITERLTARILSRDLVGGLDAELARTFHGVRQVFDRIIR